MFASSDSALIDQPGGVFIRRRDQMGPDVLEMLRSTARVVLECDGRPLGMIAESWRDAEEQAEDEEPAPPPTPVRARASGQRMEHLPAEYRRIRASGSRMAVTTGSHRARSEERRVGKEGRARRSRCR